MTVRNLEKDEAVLSFSPGYKVVVLDFGVVILEHLPCILTLILR